MRSFPLICFLLLAAPALSAQELYFPPLTGNEWAGVDPAELGWCPERVDTLLQFVQASNSKAFIVLKDGRIALERYFGGYTRDSLWYWASAGKSLAAFLAGLAREDGYLDLEDPVSDYLGAGWTSCAAEDEARIRIVHQLTMTSGLDDSEERLSGNVFCLDPACLTCLTEPGLRWAYHNAPYRLVQDVMAVATGFDFNIFTRLRLGNFIGMRGGWLNYVYYSRARDMARFGLLVLNRGVWNGATVMADTSYFNAMLRPSQALNPAYGYLWWLNGQERYRLPGVPVDLPGPLIPAAPSDLVAALGRDDQKIYVVPSEGLVVVRQGLSAGGLRPAASSFDNQLWERIMNLQCESVANESLSAPPAIQLYPNPVVDHFKISAPIPIDAIELWDAGGRQLFAASPGGLVTELELDMRNRRPGIYFVKLYTRAGVVVEKVVKGR